MELKRYVLLRKEIKTKEEVEKQLKIVSLFVDESRFIKTSDNILDLVEVGDLVEANVKLVDDYQPQISHVLSIDELLFRCVNGIIQKEMVVAIWKRQGNTYIRYEVKK